jgi:hypothetical protein
MPDNPATASQNGEPLPSESLQSVDCPDSGSCVAGGSYTDSNYDRQPLIVQLQAGAWTATEGPVPSGSQSNPLASIQGVNCPADGACIATGYYWIDFDDSDESGMILTQSDGTWTVTSSPLPSSNSSQVAPTEADTPKSEGATSDTSSSVTSSLAGVSCATDAFCAAAGVQSGSGLLETALFSTLPSVTGITPALGPASGGTDVTVAGTNLTPSSSVSFGGAPAATRYVSPNELQATSPPSVSGGPVDITVASDGLVSRANYNDIFTYGIPSPPIPTPTPIPIPIPTPSHGYWLIGSDGGVFSFGSAGFDGSTGSLNLQRPVVGVTPTTDKGGYWLVASDGGIFSFGDTQFHGSIPGLGLAPAGSSSPKRLNAPIVGMVPSYDGRGYFLVGADGGVFAFGDAAYEGSCPGIGGCAGAAVAVMPDASGQGYWLVTATGHVYTFGDAQYYGAPGPQLVPVTAAVRTPDGKGYWILFSNGVVTTFGDANYYGAPSGDIGGLNPATAIFATADGAGYWVATANGTAYNFGDAPADGGMNDTHLNGAIIAGTGY